MSESDEFGLPVPPSDLETARARFLREAEARRSGELALNRLFSALRNNLETQETARLFEDCIKRFSKRRTRGPTNSALDAFLLQEYESAAKPLAGNKTALKELPRTLSQRLYKIQLQTSDKRRVWYGASRTAIEKRLRRAIKAQNDKLASRRDDERQFRVILKEYKRISKKNRQIHKSQIVSRDK